MIRHLIAIVFVSTVVTHAEKTSKGELQVRFVAQSAPDDLGPVALEADGVRSSPFQLPLNNLTDPQTPPAKIFRMWAVDKNVSLSTITLPDEGKSFIVLLIASPKGGYSPVVMNSADPAFKPGDIYLHNNADKTVLGYVGTAKFVLAPAQGRILRPEGARAEKFYDVGIGVREAEGDRVLRATRWPDDKNVRCYIFFYVDPATQRVTYRAVDEFILKEEAPR